MLRLRRKSRILLLDDDAAIQRLVALLLKRAGHRVDVVAKGNDAIRSIEKNPYDALLLDLMMPTEGGMTVLRHLREKSPELLKRVILLTATPAAVLNTVRKEVAAIVHKPFEPEELLDAIDRLGGEGS
ncbi:MAG TPA: response regulator [Thermoanaerobaculia bacterium]|nr:response regulator [Thermoanaerobaculia bacterium]